MNKVYIRQGEGFFESEYPLEEDVGESLADYANGMYVELSEDKVKFHLDNPDASDLEVWFMDTDTPTEKKIFEYVKMRKMAAIEEYDKSIAVNGFSINGIEGWLDRDTRTSLVNTINVEMAAGMENTTLWFDINSLTLPCQLVLQMLARLEIYAHQCYNVTAQHKADVMAMESIEEIEAYDITSGYPEKLQFNAE